MKKSFLIIFLSLLVFYGQSAETGKKSKMKVTFKIQGADKQLNKQYCFIPGVLHIDGADTTLSIPYFFMSVTETSNQQYLEFLDDLKQQGRMEDYNIAAIKILNPMFDTLTLKEEFLRTHYANYPVRNIVLARKK